MLLAQFYVSLGQLAPALVTLDTMLRTPQPAADARRTSQFLGLWECDAPLVVLDVMSKKAQFQGVSPEEAMHFFTLVSVIVFLSRVSLLKNFFSLPTCSTKPAKVKTASRLAT